MALANKALDLNKLLINQSKGKQLGKKINFPIYAGIKYDGNYVVVTIKDGKRTFETSGGLFYTHLDDGDSCFDSLRDGVYLAERVAKEGKLGQRRYCNLKGPKDAQTSKGHRYRVFDYLTLEEYEKGKSIGDYNHRLKILENYTSLSVNDIARPKKIHNMDELNNYLRVVTKKGYEGIVGMQPNWKWEHHKTRRQINFFKYKKRPTVDLLCTGVTYGEGKYTGQIGALTLEDKDGRVVSVGSGLSDILRRHSPSYFIGKVIEVEYEQIMDTYIQPTFLCIRTDKTADGID